MLCNLHSSVSTEVFSSTPDTLLLLFAYLSTLTDATRVETLLFHHEMFMSHSVGDHIRWVDPLLDKLDSFVFDDKFWYLSVTIQKPKQEIKTSNLPYSWKQVRIFKEIEGICSHPVTPTLIHFLCKTFRKNISFISKKHSQVVDTSRLGTDFINQVTQLETSGKIFVYLFFCCCSCSCSHCKLITWSLKSFNTSLNDFVMYIYVHMNGCTAKMKTDQLDRDYHLLSWSVSQSYVQRNYLVPLKIIKNQNTTKRYFLFESIEKEYFQYVVTMK